MCIKFNEFWAYTNYLKQQVVSCKFYFNECVTSKRAPRASVRLIYADTLQRKSYCSLLQKIFQHNVMAGLPANLLNRLQSVLNAASAAAARSVAGLRRSDHITDTLASFHWLRAPESIIASSLNWQSLYTELFTALHLGICLICYIALLTSHQDTVSGRRPPLNWLSLCRGL